MELKLQRNVCNNQFLLLLIVPYGIETGSRPPSLHWAGAFNRTLWNWNRVAFGATGPATMTFNRTLWNWNCVADGAASAPTMLLIVPYGIETLVYSLSRISLLLLIVPYGIETTHIPLIRLGSCGLLIVPYGIETIENLITLFFRVALLIVPYGIETLVYSLSRISLLFF